MTEQTLDFTAAMTAEQVEQSEKQREKNHGMARRVTLMTLTRSKDELAAGIAEIGVDAFDEWMGQIELFQSDLKALQEMADTAYARMIVAGEAAMELEGTRA